MKSIKKFGILSITFLSIALWSCAGNTHSDHNHEHEHGDGMEMSSPHGEGKEYTSAYVCPMHCEGSGSDEAGTCPKCGMDYVMQEEHVKDGHSH